MFTVTFVLHEKTGLDRAEALRYWRTEHAEIVRAVPGVQHYVQQHAVGALAGDPPFLGVASLSFADQAGFETAAASDEFSAALADIVNFADPDQVPTAFTEAVVVVG